MESESGVELPNAVYNALPLQTGKNERERGKERGGVKIIDG